MYKVKRKRKRKTSSQKSDISKDFLENNLFKGYCGGANTS